MNPAKLFSDVLSTVQRYAPILVVHGLLLLWLSARVLDPGALPDDITIWAVITTQINSALKAIGLSLELWFVLAALVIAYLAAFQYVQSLVDKLPVLRIRYAFRYKPELLGYAGRILRTRPDPWKVSDSLNDLVDQYNNELHETNRWHPYQWQLDREYTYSSYYRTIVIVLVGSVAWAIEGGTMARSPGDVWRLVFLLGFICVVVRWKALRVIADGKNALGYWALREFTRRITDDREDPLQWKRSILIEKQAKFMAAARRHPATILQSLIYRLPERFTMKLRGRLGRLATPRWQLGDDWDIHASHAMKYQEEKHEPPEALRVDGFLKQFTVLLECPGAGLCILAPQQLGLAPAVPGGGATYSFADRRHGGHLLGVTLACDNDLSHYELHVRSYGHEKAFLAEVGYHRIELVAQRDFPADRMNLYALTKSEFNEENWPSDTNQSEKVMDGITLSFRLSMHAGSTYLMRSKMRHGTQAIVAFQCFQVEGSAKILLAWRILDVFAPAEEAPEVFAWWKPQAWKELWPALTDHKRG